MGIRSRHREMMTKIGIRNLKKAGFLGKILEVIPTESGKKIHNYLWHMVRKVSEEDKEVK